MIFRHYTKLDALIMTLDQGLRTLFTKNVAARNNPAADSTTEHLSDTDRKLSANLMRVNHAGEICAQALYQGQAFMTRDKLLRVQFEQAAREENDHLAWCEQRLTELHDQTSHLNPLWYTGSLLIGSFAGLISDKISLGFLVETERQVVAHLTVHINRLPVADTKSLAILQQMQRDEEQHATQALAAGAIELPRWVKIVMQGASKIMTTFAFYW